VDQEVKADIAAATASFVNSNCSLARRSAFSAIAASMVPTAWPVGNPASRARTPSPTQANNKTCPANALSSPNPEPY
jgi:hypothetical protein